MKQNKWSNPKGKKTPRFVVSKIGMKKGYWKIVDTKTGNTVHSGIQSKKSAEEITKSIRY